MTESTLVLGAREVRHKMANLVADVGSISIMVWQMIVSAAGKFPSFRLIVEQMNTIGVGSLGLVFVISLFTGGVAAVQAAYQFSTVVPMKYIGSVILRSVIIELGPVLTALVVGGRVGASIAAELGTMRVTEQIDAMSAMGINPLRYLIFPRVLAATVMLPVITIFSNAIAVAGGYLVAVLTIGVSSATYTNALKDFFYLKDLMSGLLKALCFGNIIGTMGCYYGYNAEGGAEGVGKATTHAVVASCVLVLIVDYVLATVIFQIIFAT